MIGRKIISYIDTPTEVITLAEAKAHLDSIRTDQDSAIEMYLSAAIAWASNVVSFSIRRATVDYYFDSNIPFSTETKTRNGLRIPANVISITSVAYHVDDHTYTTMSTDDYYFENQIPIPTLTIVNVPDIADHGASYRVRVVEGYYSQSGSPTHEHDNLPDDVKVAILLKLRDLYDFRGNETIGQTSELTRTAEHYLFPYSKLQIL